MALAIISYPELDPADHTWIEAARALHDPQARMVAAHITLVFPFEGLDEASAAGHAQTIAAATQPVGFRLTAAHAVRDRFSPRSHVFLTPDAGDAQIRRLHVALYSGPLAAYLRADIPYAPHITVAAAESFEAAEAIAAGLGPIAIAGRLAALELVGFDGRTVTPLRRFPLTA
ncbi:2'-5' RNA ligase [Caulobacter ginsengisoli]|uniref:2'-5' RNA ligase n=1 Tax=Caulobacter ginsengisoli TaxID=400775 RepID=A0ABU0INJ3_9CAUL|nr:2'-5' RNA ligase family protein [Caulobacter ginsengisoli]MDQ0462542.1 2'-5' RNA ligase [Caulobacter ginsengisoli]